MLGICHSYSFIWLGGGNFLLQALTVTALYILVCGVNCDALVLARDVGEGVEDVLRGERHGEPRARVARRDARLRKGPNNQLIYISMR